MFNLLSLLAIDVDVRKVCAFVKRTAIVCTIPSRKYSHRDSKKHYLLLSTTFGIVKCGGNI